MLPFASPAGAGASAHARYRQEWRAGRTRRLTVRATIAAAAAVPVAVLVDWRAGLAAGALVAAVDTVQRWRRHEAVRTWRQGARGERATARALRRLEKRGYLAIHDRALPHSSANVDHLLVGPTGVFVVDSKNWNPDRRITTRGRGVKVGGTWGQTVVRGILHEARVVADALARATGAPVEVIPLLAIHGPYVPAGGIMVEGVRMLPCSALPGSILRRGRRLDSRTEQRLREAADRLFPPYLRTPGDVDRPPANVAADIEDAVTAALVDELAADRSATPDPAEQPGPLTISAHHEVPAWMTARGPGRTPPSAP